MKVERKWGETHQEMLQRYYDEGKYFDPNAQVGSKTENNKNNTDSTQKSNNNRQTNYNDTAKLKQALEEFGLDYEELKVSLSRESIIKLVRDELNARDEEFYDDMLDHDDEPYVVSCGKLLEINNELASKGFTTYENLSCMGYTNNAIEDMVAYGTNWSHIYDTSNIMIILNSNALGGEDNDDDNDCDGW